MARPFFLWSLLFCCLAARATSARAEAGALLPVRAEASVSKQDIATAEQAIFTYFAQFPEAIPILPPEEGVRRAGAAYRECGDASCGKRFAQGLEVDFAVLVRLFTPERPEDIGSLSVSLISPEGFTYTGSVTIGAAGVHAAATRAIDIAHERMMLGPGPWLRITGPSGSRVRIDGGELHAIPYRGKYAPGRHRVIAESRSGSLLYDAAVTLPDDPGHHELLELRDEPALHAEQKQKPAQEKGPLAAPPPAHEEGRYWQGRRSKWNYIVGVPLAAAGLFYTIVGSRQYIERGDCARKIEGQCREEKTVNAGSALALGLGLAGVAAGGVILGLGVFRERDRSPSGAHLQLGGKF